MKKSNNFEKYYAKNGAIITRGSFSTGTKMEIGGILGDDWSSKILKEKYFVHPKYGEIMIVGVEGAGSNFGRIKKNRVKVRKSDSDTFEKSTWLNLEKFLKDASPSKKFKR